MPELTPERILELRAKLDPWNERDRRELNRFEGICATPEDTVSSGRINTRRIYSGDTGRYPSLIK